jgi:hypothetical protein
VGERGSDVRRRIEQSPLKATLRAKALVKILNMPPANGFARTHLKMQSNAQPFQLRLQRIFALPAMDIYSMQLSKKRTAIASPEPPGRVIATGYPEMAFSRSR